MVRTPALSYRTPDQSARPDGLLEPGDQIADANCPTGTHLSECAASPLSAHRLPKSWQCLVHPLARQGFTADGELNASDLQDSAAGLVERHAADEQVGAPRRGIDIAVKLTHQPRPALSLEQRHLTTPTAIDALKEAAFDVELRLLHRVHRSAMCPLDPDRLESPLHRQFTSMRQSTMTDVVTVVEDAAGTSASTASRRCATSKSRIPGTSSTSRGVVKPATDTSARMMCVPRRKKTARPSRLQRGRMPPANETRVRGPRGNGAA